MRRKMAVMAVRRLDTALPAGEDPRRYARVLARVHEATLAGQRPPAPARRVIEDSWRRMLRRGLDPNTGRDPSPLDAAELEHRRRTSRLSDVLPILRDGLTPVTETAAHLMVVVDATGRVLWREGGTGVRLAAEDIGFVEGSSWDEQTVGTNAIGTALVTGRPLQVYSAEHFVRTHHRWTCAAAPLIDPRDGGLLGVVDLSGPAATVHPSTLALVDAVARLAGSHLRAAHLEELERLRTRTADTLGRTTEPALVTDVHGWVAAVRNAAPVRRIRLPSVADSADSADGADPTARADTDIDTWLPTLGRCALTPLAGGWLIRPITTADADPAAGPSRATLDVRDHRRPSLRMTGGQQEWTIRLTARHAEILYVLATRRSGRGAAELATDLFDDPSRTITVRAEMSRLRRHLGAVLDHRPYRFADDVEVTVLAPSTDADLLPASMAPAVRKARRTN